MRDSRLFALHGRSLQVKELSELGTISIPISIHVQWREYVVRILAHSLALLLAPLLATPAFATAANFTDKGAPSNVHGEAPLDLAASVEIARLIGDTSELARSSIPISEYRAFSGIGALVCSVDGVQHSATAFLVGKFDIAVTVAHAFEFEHRAAQPQECKYLVYGPLGQIRERIPLTQIHSQWRAQQETFGRPDCDLAVIRLAAPAHLPQKTLALSKFAFTGAPISLIGFSPHLGTDPQQRRLRGEVYPRPRNSCVRFSHDVDPGLISSGAPLIDRRDGVVIGIHDYLRPSPTKTSGSCQDRGNAMLLMNDWLEQTLRAQIAQ